MRILITNDDGINAPGLAVLHDIASAIAGPTGEVWTVAPAQEQSGVGHCINYTHPTMVTQLEPRRFAVQGSPADCVLAALFDILPGEPDLILSGVNRGNNAAENVLYSGTIGAAMEAALQGHRAIALSQYYGPRNMDPEHAFAAAAAHGVATINRLLAADVWDDADYCLFWNVNFPPVPAADVAGFQVTTQGFRRGGHHHMVRAETPGHRHFLWVKGGDQQRATGAGTDAQANVDGYISATPMRADLTAHDVIDQMRDRLA
ncbi:stationary phase survival protein SurE [Loktanella sp. 3ANDIMAR09]|uniref:5'/3'-nucleotidase SurE n=1 Tax=Loktanella sp. 3ANDIMAR09 TaxID=1225657 RepID=UPI0006FBC832|nr:5'/3'-nucleotidase SurE [Loktanella sp. 3ANDIMAR09]KQI68766.1 stationary phase survival protein SurE [Loktanella sp. 3ANDIMAR09]